MMAGQPNVAGNPKTRDELKKLLDVSAYVKNIETVSQQLVSNIENMMQKHGTLLNELNDVYQLEAVDSKQAKTYAVTAKNIIKEVDQSKRIKELKQYKLLIRKAVTFYKLTLALTKHIDHDCHAAYHDLSKALIKKRMVNHKINKYQNNVNMLNSGSFGRH